MAKNKNEIFSSCCAFGGGTEAVYVLESKCPIDRTLGKREVSPLFGDGEARTECTCVYYSGTSGCVIPPCQHYEGIKKVQRNKRKVWKVFCAAVED